MKSTVEQIRQRFDQDVERFSSLETGHTAFVDSLLMLDLITKAAAAVTPHARHLLDIGCGAGNYSLKMLQYLPDLDVTLVDLSQPMLTRAQQRVQAATAGKVAPVQADIRELQIDDNQVDIILAGAVFHHLRGELEWQSVFARCFQILRIGGSLWIADMVDHSPAVLQALMYQRYGDYLVQLRDEAYRDHVYTYIEQEDTPRSLLFQVDLLRQVGFGGVEILHKNACFAAFGAIKT